MKIGIGVGIGAGSLPLAESVLTGPAQNVAAHEIISTGSGPGSGSFVATADGEVVLFVTTRDNAPTSLTVGGVAATLLSSTILPGTSNNVARGIYQAACTSGSNSVACTSAAGFISVYGLSYSNLNVRSVAVTQDTVDPPANGQSASITFDVPGETLAIASFDGEEAQTDPTGWTDLGDDSLLGFYWQVVAWYYNSDAAGDGALTDETLTFNSNEFLNGSTTSAYVLSSAQPPQINAPEPYISGAVYPRVGGTTSATLSWSGTYSGGEFGNIEARVVEKTSRDVIVAWQTFATAPTGGTFTGTISVRETVLSTDEEFVMEFRWSGNTSVTATQTNGWRVGVFAVMYGQSNMALRPNTTGGSGATAFTTGGVFVNTYSYAQGASGTPIITTTSSAPGVTGLINSFIAAADRAIVVVNAAVAGRSSDNLANGTGWSEYYEDIVDAAVLTLGEEPEVILWHQGEENVAQTDILQANYLADLNTIRAALASRNSGSMATADVKMTIGGLGSSTGAQDEATWHSFNEMLATLESESGLAYTGGNRGVPVPDGIHWDADAYYYDSLRQGRRMSDLLGYSTVGDPVFEITGATNQSSTVVRVTVTHGLGTDFTPTSSIGGFEVYNGTTWFAATGARNSATTIDLTHAATGTVTAIRGGWDLDPITGWPQDNTASGQAWLEHTQSFTVT